MKFSLRSARVHRRLTQKEIAKKLNVYQAMYSKWENGKTPLNRVTRLAIASVLEFDIDTIEWPEVKRKDGGPDAKV